MRLPGFTAEFSIYRTSRVYAQFPASGSAAGPVAPQAVAGVDVDYYQYVAQQYINCKPPFCGYVNGQCHCVTALLPTGPLSQHTPAV
jgi:hypothetical protein